MKPKIFLTAFIVTALFTNCKKEFAGFNEEKINGEKKTKTVQRAYSDNFTTQYQFIPDILNGWDPAHPSPFLAWYPGNGDGNATHVGKAKTYFNQYVPFNPPFFSSIAAPVTMFAATQLAAAGYVGIPAMVNSVVYDDKGNSIWFHQTSNTTMPVSETRINFTGISKIIGGTGKFMGATGEVKLKGYFNPLDQQDAGVGSTGSIEY